MLDFKVDWLIGPASLEVFKSFLKLENKYIKIEICVGRADGAQSAKSHKDKIENNNLNRYILPDELKKDSEIVVHDKFNEIMKATLKIENKELFQQYWYEKVINAKGRRGSKFYLWALNMVLLLKTEYLNSIVQIFKIFEFSSD